MAMETGTGVLPGILRKTFRAFARAWYDRQPPIATDGPALNYLVQPEVCLADWTSLDAGPLMQRGLVRVVASTDGRGQAWPIVDFGTGRRCWRLLRITAGATDGGVSFTPRVGWWMSNQVAGGATFTPQSVVEEPQALTDLGQVGVYFGDLNDLAPAYHFGDFGTGAAQVERIASQIADGRYLNLRIDTGQGAGAALEITIELEALRADDLNQLQVVGRETYRGDA